MRLHILLLLSLLLFGISGWVFQAPSGSTGNTPVDGYLATPTGFPPTWTPTPLPLCVHHGDVNSSGTLTAADSQLVFYFVLGLEEPETYLQACAADCDGNESITAADSQTIFESVLSLDSCVDAIP